MDKRKAAKTLYLEGYPQKNIAKIVGVTEQTISAWKDKDGWTDSLLKKSLIEETNADLVQELIEYQLRTLVQIKNNWVTEGKHNLIQKGEIDALSKLYATIKKKDMIWTNYIQVMRDFVDWLQIKNLDTAKSILGHVDEYLSNKNDNL
jgi:predicted transcriptional regulator